MDLFFGKTSVNQWVILKRLVYCLTIMMDYSIVYPGMVFDTRQNQFLDPAEKYSCITGEYVFPFSGYIGTVQMFKLRYQWDYCALKCPEIIGIIDIAKCTGKITWNYVRLAVLRTLRFFRKKC